MEGDRTTAAEAVSEHAPDPAGAESAADTERSGIGTVQAVLEAMTRSAHGEGALVIVGGAPGASCTGVLRHAVATSQRPSLWVHAMPGTAEGEQGCLGQWVGAEGDPADGDEATMTPVSGPTMADLLGDVEEILGRDTVVVVDNFHLLTPASANALLVWSQAARMQGRTLLMGYHASLDVEGVGALLTMATDLQWVDLQWLTDEDVRAGLTEQVQWATSELLAAGAAATAGNPAMLRCLQRAVGREEVVGPEQWRAAHRRALEAFGLYVLAQQHHDVQALARVVAWVYPQLPVADIAHHLGLDAHVAVRVERLLRELALVSDHPLVMEGVRDALHDHSSTAVRRRCARAAREMIADRTGARWTRFALMTEAAEDLNGTRDLACAAYEEALAAGHHQRAATVADRFMEGVSDPADREWARAARLRVWLDHDWRAAAAEMSERPVAEGIEAPLQVSPLFGLEAPEAARRLACCEPAVTADTLERCLWAGIDVPVEQVAARRELLASNVGYATGLALRAVTGHPVGSRVAALDSACSGGDWMDTDAPTATRLAVGWLALADYERAQQWAALATFNADPQDRAERGLGHLLRAQSLLRQGDFPRADEESRAAAGEFGAIGAVNLGAVASLTGAHALLEDRQDPGGVPDFPAADVHPLFAAYHLYVQGRHALQCEHYQDAVRQFFETGRALERLCPNNPSLTNWRLHLSAIFRATGQHEFTEHIEQDLVRSWRRWAAVEPAAVGRRAAILGRLAEEVLAPGRQTVGLDLLSPAERRVVDVVAQGKNNREVANHLFLSKRTVDTHLGNVYRKLKIESREQLGALVAADTACSSTALIAAG